MQEEYLIKKMIQGKTEEELRIELMQSIIETKEKLKVARCNFEYAEDELIDVAKTLRTSRLVKKFLFDNLPMLSNIRNASQNLLVDKMLEV